MREFAVPFDIKTEDKIIGGYISLRQAGWLFITIIVAVGLFAINRGYLVKAEIGLHIDFVNLIIRFIIWLLVAVFFSMLAFLKIKELNFDEFLFRKIKYKIKKHIYLP